MNRSMVAGLGETIYDILFDQGGRPLSAHPGGSVFNALISLVRSGHPAAFVGETGDDLLGHRIAEFLQQNRIDTGSLTFRNDMRTQLSIAFLNNHAQPSYQFYNDYPAQRLEFRLPELLTTGDAFLFGSYFALNPAITLEVGQVLKAARNAGALLYYDINFRSSHRAEAHQLRTQLFRNMSVAHIVKASEEDLVNLFDQPNARLCYESHIRPHCPLFISTAGAQGATLHTPDGQVHINALSIAPVSTVGAGDAFNAGVLAALLDKGATAADTTLTAFVHTLAEAMRNGIGFATEVCLSLDNAIAPRK